MALRLHTLAIIGSILIGSSGCEGETLPVVRDLASIAAPQSRTSPLVELQTEEDSERAPQREIRIAILLPLSGPDAFVGKALLNAATLALFDSHDQRLHIIPADTKGLASGAEAAMQELLLEQPDLIIGPLFSESISIVKPLAQQAGLTIIGFSSDHTVAGDGTFLLNFRPEEQIRRIIGYASERGYGKFAALIPETRYGSRTLEIFGPTVTAQGKQLIAVEFYPPDQENLFDPVKKIAHHQQRRKEYRDEVAFLDSLGEEDDFADEMKDEIKNLETLRDVEFDAILLPEGGALLRTLAPMLAFYEIDPARTKVLGTGLWDDEMLRHEPQLLGGWFSAPEHDVSEKFLNRYQNTYHQKAPRIATLGYDAMALAATLVRTRKTSDFSIKALSDENGFLGLDGIFRFREDGLIERGLAVYEVGKEGFTIISPAPQSFISLNDPESDATGYSAPTSLTDVPLADHRPFPYTPVHIVAVQTPDQ